MDNDISHIYQVPFVIKGSFMGTPVDIQPVLMGEFPDIPLQPLEMGTGRDRGDNEKIRPHMEGAEVHDYHIPALVFPEEPPQGQGGGFIVHR
jgi:hypothetical protein